MGSHDDIVHVKVPDRAASSSPNFIIEHDGRFYVTVGVLEYDPATKGLTDEQKRGIEDVRKMFNSGQKEYPAQASRLSLNGDFIAHNTEPLAPPNDP